MSRIQVRAGSQTRVSALENRALALLIRCWNKYRSALFGIRYAKVPAGRPASASLAEAEIVRQRQAQSARKGAGNAVGGLLWTLMAFPTQASIAVCYVQSSGAMLVMSAWDNLQNYTYLGPEFSTSFSPRDSRYTHTHTYAGFPSPPLRPRVSRGLKDRAAEMTGRLWRAIELSVARRSFAAHCG